MRIETAIVRINGAVFVLYGVAFVMLPRFSSQLVTGAVPASASGMIDMRATYGGMSVAVGALLLLLAASRDRVRTGLLGVVLIMLGMAGGRLVGIVLDGSANQVMVVYLGLELAMAAISLWALARGAGERGL